MCKECGVYRELFLWYRGSFRDLCNKVQALTIGVLGYTALEPNSTIELLSSKKENPMPAKSKQQWKLMKGIAEGTIPEKGKLTKRVAREYIASQRTPKGLPKRKQKAAK